MNNDLCRIMFEKEYSLFNEMTKKPDGTYADWNLQLTWNCWQKSWDTCKASDTSDTSDTSIVTATTFQLTHSDPKHPSCILRVGDKVNSPLGKAIIVWLDEETGNCKIKLL